MIRKARPSDAADIAALLHDSFDVALTPYMAYLQPGIDAFLRSRIAHSWSASDRRFWVSYGDGRLLAFAETQQFEADTQFLSYICVAEHARGRGLASSLIAHWLDAESAIGTVMLDVHANNGPARRLYERLGFEADSTALWLRRPLPEPAEPVMAADLHVAQACLDTYGFAELQLLHESVPRIGLLGHTVVRVTSLSSLYDDALLARIASAFPERREAFAIVPSEQVERAALGNPGGIILESIRMAASASEIRARLARVGSHVPK